MMRIKRWSGTADDMKCFVLHEKYNELKYIWERPLVLHLRSAELSLNAGQVFWYVM